MAASIQSQFVQSTRALMLKALRVLVVEDDFIIAQDIKERLIDLKFLPVGHTAFGEDAIKLVSELRPDLVLADIRLAGSLDGIDVAVAVRQKFNLPAIILSASIDDQVIKRAAAASPFAFINKPMSDWEFGEIMQAWRVQTLRPKYSVMHESAVAM
jgi:CheY-like chemotaxis protein